MTRTVVVSFLAVATVLFAHAQGKIPYTHFFTRNLGLSPQSFLKKWLLEPSKFLNGFLAVRWVSGLPLFTCLEAKNKIR